MYLVIMVFVIIDYLDSICVSNAIDNFCSRSLSFGYLYKNWLYLVILLFLIYGFDWNSFCELHAGDNFCSRSLSSGSLYESWLCLAILSLLTPDSIGFFYVVYMAFIISVHGVCHLALLMRFGCT